ncbi:reverse transcriptase domain protein [Apiospora phragmitis]|uniref:Reverse transcriptase domain protein n=1 Tax=Apiospora phragmitis TaxID=2905665 RepID=A0ABR1X5D8_9PEZI
MSTITGWLHPVLRVWICIALATVALTTETNNNNNNTTNNASSTATSPPVRLANVQQCPVSPKPMCDDQTCQSATFLFPMQPREPLPRRGRPAPPAHPGRLPLLPLPLHVECTDHRSGAPEGTRVCAGEPLRGCACQTSQDRLETIQARCAAHGWAAADFPDNEIDFEPDSGDDGMGEAHVSGSSGSAPPPMATMHHHRLGLLPHYWAVLDGGFC